MVKVSLSSWIWYYGEKLVYSYALGLTNLVGGSVKQKELKDFIVKHVIDGRLTFLHWTKGEDIPSIHGKGATLLVRKLIAPPTNLKFKYRIPFTKITWTRPCTFELRSFEPRSHIARDLFVGDVVLLKNPEEPDNYLVRRVAGIEGYEMVSTNENEESFVLKKNQYWVVAANEKLKAKEAFDSRTFGPVHMNNIKGRVIYRLRSAEDHGPVQNSEFSMEKDSPVLEMELNIDEMVKSQEAQFEKR